MNILPFGRMLPVHCCCEPSKRLGWVPVRKQRRGPIRFMLGLPSYDMETNVVTSPPTLDTEIETIEDDRVRGCGPYLAVKSANQPVDVWRKVSGFVEERQ